MITSSLKKNAISLERVTVVRFGRSTGEVGSEKGLMRRIRRGLRNDLLFASTVEMERSFGKSVCKVQRNRVLRKTSVVSSLA